MINQAVTGCWHSACKKCLTDYIQHQVEKNELPRCFNCREPVNSRDVFEVIRHEEDPPSPATEKFITIESDDEVTVNKSSPAYETKSKSQTTTHVSLRRLNQPSSAKISALMTHLVALRRTAPSTKSVVFSQFTSFLDLIEPSLDAAHIPFLRFDGSMSQKQRAAVLLKFSSDDSGDKKKKGMVLLLSLRAGGVGLNLTSAERVFMMDPWWSWAVEAQAIDRVHRMGQEKEVQVVRFVCEESIEEKMLKIQDRKKFM